MPTKQEWSKVATWVMGILILISGYLYKDAREDIDSLRENQIEIRIETAKQSIILEKILSKMEDREKRDR